MLGRYEPIETMRSWPGNGMEVGAVSEECPVVSAASNELRLFAARGRGKKRC